MKDDFTWLFCLLGILLYFTVKYLTKLYIKYSYKHNILAYPIERSAHKEIIPTGGGLIFAGSFLIALFVSTIGIHDIVIRESIYKIIFVGLSVLFLGFIDDKYSLKARYKLVMQIFISFIMVGLGFKITYFTNPFGSQIMLHFFSIPVTVLWYLVMMNSINLIDGLDGLASGIAMIACLILMVFSFYSKNFLVFINSFLFFISLAAFLKYNYPPAKIFMGDSGSLFIGFILSSLSIAGNEVQFKGLTTFTLLVPITVMFIPFGDTFFAIIRRIKNKQYIFKADKSHLHHKMIELGLSPKAVTLLCWFITLIFGIIALGYLFVGKQIMLIVLVFVSLLLIGLFFYLYKKELFK
jgi:UDP-GlcNAc:undecaprenyl-phosphate GlcNAc-1-phosphate transferase